MVDLSVVDLPRLSWKTDVKQFWCYCCCRSGSCNVAGLLSDLFEQSLKDWLRWVPVSALMHRTWKNCRDFMDRWRSGHCHLEWLRFQTFFHHQILEWMWYSVNANVLVASSYWILSVNCAGGLSWCSLVIIIIIIVILYSSLPPPQVVGSNVLTSVCLWTGYLGSDLHEI